MVCPTCKTDVMVTGWFESQVKTTSYMRFNGRGAVTIATTLAVADKVSCLCCGAALDLTPVEIMRVA